MKRILIIMIIFVVSVVFTACSDSSDSEKTNKEEVQTNEESEVAEEEETEEETNVGEGGTYTDEITRAVTIVVPAGYIARDDTFYSTENTVATVTVMPQDADSEEYTSFLLIQVAKTENAEVYAETYIKTFAKNNEFIDEIEIAGLKGFYISAEDEITEWQNENYVLVGPQSPAGRFDYIVYIMGYGLESSYVDDVHNMIYSLDIDFDKL